MKPPNQFFIGSIDRSSRATVCALSLAFISLAPLPASAANYQGIDLYSLNAPAGVDLEVNPFGPGFGVGITDGGQTVAGGAPAGGGQQALLWNRSSTAIDLSPPQ